jgi:ADP-heptose:LPS heptosyltransferase
MAPSRVLFIAEGQLGDLLLLTPALRALKTTFPAVRISVLVLERRSSSSPSGVPLVHKSLDTALGTNPHVDEVYVLNREGLRARRGIARLQGEAEVILFLRRKRFDGVICTFPEDRFVLWAFASGARVRVGEKGQGFDTLLTHALPIHKSDRGVREYYCNLVRALGARVGSIETEYVVSSSAHGWAYEYLRKAGLDTSKVVVVHPGASGDYKIWPPERYAELIDQLQAIEGIRVLLCRGPQDGKVTSAIRGRMKSPIIEANPESIGHLAALLKKSILCISNDSGPRHLAVAVGTPSIALFRMHHSREWKVYQDTPTCVVLESGEKCQACPAGECLDRMPAGKKFGAHCLWSLSTGAVERRALEVLASL